MKEIIQSNEVKKLEARFNKKLDWIFYMIMAIILMIIASNYYVLKNFAEDINQALEFKPLQGMKKPTIRSA
jgi:hypothetical protein